MSKQKTFSFRFAAALTFVATLAAALASASVPAAAPDVADTKPANAAQNTAGKIIASHASVTNLSCEVRREIEMPNGSTTRILSRVSFKRPNLLHVETASPVKKTIVCDGETLAITEDGKTKKSAVKDLPESRRAELRKVPGTIDDELEFFASLPETVLPPNDEFPVRAGYAVGGGAKIFAVLSLDSLNRLARFELFADESMAASVVRMDFSSFVEAAPGAWIPRVHRTVVDSSAGAIVTTTRVGNIAANKEVADFKFKISAASGRVRPAVASDSDFRAPAHSMAGMAADAARQNADATRAGMGARMDAGAGSDAESSAIFAPSAAASASANSSTVGAAAQRQTANGRDSGFSYPARGFIWFYRTQISPAIGARCQIYPSCSEYFVQAARKHGVAALPMIADRFVREPEIFSQGRHPVELSDGRILWGDAVSDHDWWF